ncbi:hypothetical protein M3P21_04695 [Ruegeria sp. 2012CJ41-6]|uniref:PH domain-containing protein n=1 Tax=Ruegeria spongiae TaxID=2942209 RepID=A0ABT0Q0V9_9RHOB|nr:hypothetical protein [Ruegeria spongiae]MCL6282823.1 hypothetical protein [Ruegeria spongiae]
MADPVIRFVPDRQAYIRAHAWLAAFGMALAMAVLWMMGNPYIWTGAPAGLAAIMLRGWYMSSEELSAVWELRDGALRGPVQTIPLPQIETVRTLGSAVQVITGAGDKHLIKFQADPAATKAAIEGAMT